MDDKKNVSFVSGLALILSALALLLIGIIQISATPYSETLEKVINTKLEALETRLDVKIDNGLKQINKAEENAILMELKNFDANLGNWLARGANGYSEKVRALKSSLDNLILTMDPGAKAPAPAAVPEEKKEAKEKKK